MNKLTIINVNKSAKYVEIKYRIEGVWKEYFSSVDTLKIKYSKAIESVPDDILLVPLVANLLPVVWLCDAELVCESLDKVFFESIDAIKRGYESMYPQLKFLGKVSPNNLVDHRKDKGIESEVSVFFSGGVDAYTTLLRHIEEKPILVTVWGADVKLDDIEGWTNVSENTKKTAEAFGLQYRFVKSNFRELFHYGNLDNLVSKTGDGWWHGFQCGIGIITLIAPLSYVDNIRVDYIASSFPEKMKGMYTCASDPMIDNNVSFAFCKTIHDGYELDRQEKVKYILGSGSKNVDLRVCWESTGGKNCCHCEKCYRTILEIVSEGGDPNSYGFVWDDRHIRRCKRDMMTKITSAQFNLDQFYPPMQRAMKRNSANIPDYFKYRWFMNIDFQTFNSYKAKQIYNSPLMCKCRTLKQRFNNLIWKITRTKNAKF